MIPLRAGFLLGAAVCLVTSAASAEPSVGRVQVHWAAPDECPDDVRLVHEVEGLLGQSLPDEDQEPPLLTVRVHVQGSRDQGYAAKVSFTSAQGDEDRYLEHPSCDQLVHALALVIALAIDPERVRATQLARAAASADEEETPRMPLPREPAANSTNVARDPAPVPAPTRASPPRAPEQPEPPGGPRLALRDVAGAGSLPKFGFGVEAALGWHQARFRAEAVGRYWLERQTPVTGTPSASLELGLATLGVRACWLPLRGEWQLAACAGGAVGQLRGDGLGVENPRERTARYSEISMGLEIARVRSQLAPEAGLQLSGALERPPFGVLENGRDDQVFRPAAWGFNLFFGFAFEL